MKHTTAFLGLQIADINLILDKESRVCFNIHTNNEREVRHGYEDK